MNHEKVIESNTIRYLTKGSDRVELEPMNSTGFDIGGTLKVVNADNGNLGKLEINGTDSNGDVLRINGVDIQDYVYSFNTANITSTPATLSSTDKIVDVNVQGNTPPDRIWMINFPAAGTVHQKWYKIHIHGKVGKDTSKGGMVWMKPSTATEWMNGKRESDGGPRAFGIQEEGTYVFRSILNYRNAGANGWIIDASHPKSFNHSPFFIIHAATTGNISDLTTDLDAGNTIDGYTLAENNLILLKNQSTASQNGVYIVPAAGVGLVPDRAHYMEILLVEVIFMLTK